MKVVQLFKLAITDWVADRAPQLGAALAFYSTFSLVPLLAVVIALASYALGAEAAELEVLRTTRLFLGPRVTESIAEMIRWSHNESAAGSLTFLGIGALIFSASGVFGELQSSMNLIWNVPTPKSSGVLDFLKRRFFSILMVLGTAFLLLVSLVATTLLATAQNFVWGAASQENALAIAINSLASFLIVSGVFGLILKYIPDIRMSWGDILPGAVFTGALFEAGKFGIGWYLGRPSISAAFGTAASIIVVLLWVYYSAQILFFGAELTQVYAKLHGSKSAEKTSASARTKATDLQPQTRGSLNA